MDEFEGNQKGVWRSEKEFQLIQSYLFRCVHYFEKLSKLIFIKNDVEKGMV